jgi:hypothetical protein
MISVDLAAVEGDDFLRNMGLLCEKHDLRSVRSLLVQNSSTNTRVLDWSQYSLGADFVNHNIFTDLLREPILCPLEKMLRVE